jgi:hypothetical protein
MLSWVIQITILSVILVFLVHHLINFFKSTLTVPKIKDLVNAPAQKYENMLNIIGGHNSNNANSRYGYNTIDLLPSLDDSTSLEGITGTGIREKKEKEPSMKNELKTFLKKQLHSVSSGTEISALDSMANNSYYAEI